MTTPDQSRAIVPWWGRVAGPLARVAAQFGRRRAGGDAATRARDTKEDRDLARIEGRAHRAAAKRQADEEREVRRRDEARRREDVRLAHERAIDTAFANYQRVRDWAARMREMEGRAPEPRSDSERRMAAALAPLWNADRATIAALRRWCDPLHGAPSPEGGSFPDDTVDWLRRQVTVLSKQHRAEFLVPEAATLGKCSVMVSDALHSEESIKFALAAVALRDGAVLTAFQSASDRRLVWEIGGGWGGFARHFKTLCPNVTYLITGTPERLLVSAVYVMAVFPDARVRFHLESDGGDTWGGWEQLDFVFATDAALDTLRPPRLELAIDLGELVLTTPERVSAHVRRAYEWGSTYLYSLLPASAADQPASPWHTIERWYWPQPIPARTDRNVVYTREVAPEREFVHLVGWRRMRA